MHILNLLELGPINYLRVDRLQRWLNTEVANGNHPDTLIVWESQDVYTAGRRTKPEDIPNHDIPVIEMDRGGSVTYHGPGQLVVYPIIKVKPPQDVVRFVRVTEQALIQAMSEINLETSVVAGRSGVWVQRPGQIDEKLCAIGIKFARETTMHGLALNVTTDLSKFGEVVPCGITDAGVTSLQAQGLQYNLENTANLVIKHLALHYREFQIHPSELANDKHIAGNPQPQQISLNSLDCKNYLQHLALENELPG